MRIDITGRQMIGLVEAAHVLRTTASDIARAGLDGHLKGLAADDPGDLGAKMRAAGWLSVDEEEAKP